MSSSILDKPAKIREIGQKVCINIDTFSRFLNDKYIIYYHTCKTEFTSYPEKRQGSIYLFQVGFSEEFLLLNVFVLRTLKAKLYE